MTNNCDTQIIQVAECEPQTLVNNGDGTYTFDPTGVNVTFPAHYLSGAVFNTGTNTLSLTMSNGTVLDAVIPPRTTIADSNVSDGIIEITYAGNTYNISEGFTTIAGPNINGEFTATSPNGDTITWNEGGVTSIVDNLDGTFTTTLSDGTDITWTGVASPLFTVSSGPDNVIGNATTTADVDMGEHLHIYSSDSSINITVSEGSGIVNLTSASAGNTSVITDNGDGTYDHDDGTGTITVIQGGFTGISQNGLSGVMTFTYPDSSTVVINMPTLANNANGTYTFSPSVGANVSINTVTTITDNGNGTTTVTNTAGNSAILYNNFTDLVDNADGTITFTLPDLSTVVIDIADILQYCAIDNIGDVDTTTSVPVLNEVLTWDGTNWVPLPAQIGTGTVDTITVTTDGTSTGISTGGTAADPTVDIVLNSTDANNLLDIGADGGVHLDPADITNTVLPPYATLNSTDGNSDKVFDVNGTAQYADTTAFTGADFGRLRIGNTKSGVLYDSGIVAHNSAWSFSTYGSGVIGGAGTFDCGTYADDNSLPQARFWAEYTPYSSDGISGPPVMALFECTETSPGTSCAGTETCYFDFSASQQNPVTNLRAAESWDVSNSDWTTNAIINDILDGTPETITNYGDFGTGLNVTVSGDRNHAIGSGNSTGANPFITLKTVADNQVTYSEMTFTFTSAVTGALIFDNIRLGQTVAVTADVNLEYSDYPNGTPGLTVTGDGTTAVNLTTAIGDNINRSGMLCGVDITTFTFTFTSKNTNAFTVDLQFTFFAEDTTYGTHIYRSCTDDGEGNSTFARISGTGGTEYTSVNEYMCETACP